MTFSILNFHNVKNFVLQDDKTLWSFAKYGLAGGVALWILYRQTESYIQKRRNVAKIRDKQNKFQSRVDALRTALASSGDGQLVTPSRRLILDLGIHELVGKLKEGLLDPVDVLEAYQVSQSL